ncbi:MAG: TonB family protein [Myxococcota bacterium]
MRMAGSLYRLGIPLAWLGVAPVALAAEPTLPELQSVTPAAYPERALERAIEGDVVLQLTIDEEGAVVEVAPLEEAGHGFDGPAIESAWTMRFEPAHDARGRPVAAVITYRYPFRMDDVPPLSIEGVLREQAGKKHPIANATVRATGPDEALARTRTDDDGRFRFAGLAPGSWILTVQGRGLVTSSASVDVPEGDAYADGVVLSAELVPDWEQAEFDEFVEVVAQRQADPAEREISHELVVTLPGSLGDPVRALQNLPGVARAPFGSGQLQIRGGGPEDTSYLLNGTPIPIAFHFTAVTTVVAADLLRAVDFLPGSWGVRYGRAIGGIVDLETDDDLPSHATTSVSFDIFQATGFTRQRLGKRTTLALAARRSYIDTIAQPVLSSRDAGDLRVPRYYDAQLHFVQTTQGNGRVTATLMASEDRFRLLGVEGGDAVSYKTAFQKGVLRWLQPGPAGFSAETVFSVGPEVQELVLSDERTDLGALGVPVDLFGDLPSVGIVREEAIPRWSLRHEWLRDPAAGWLGVRAGLDLLWGKQTLQYTIGTPEAGQIGVAMPALYAEPTLRLGPVDVTPGVRWEVYDASNALADSVVDPRLRARLDLGHTEVLGGVGLFSQPPAMRELLAREGPSLGFERSRQATLAVTQQLGVDAKVGVAVYHNQLTGLIVGRDELFRFDRTTLVDATHFDPFLNAGVGRALRHRAAQHLDHAAARAVGVGVAVARLPHRPAHRARAPRRRRPARQRHPHRQPGARPVAPPARARYATGPALTPVAGAMYSTDLQQWLPICGDPYSDRAPAFFALDLRVDRTFRFRTWKLEMYTEVQNATNHRNVEIRAGTKTTPRWPR